MDRCRDTVRALLAGSLLLTIIVWLLVLHIACLVIGTSHGLSHFQREHVWEMVSTANMLFDTLIINVQMPINHLQHLLLKYFASKTFD